MRLNIVIALIITALAGCTGHRIESSSVQPLTTLIGHPFLFPMPTSWLKGARIFPMAPSAIGIQLDKERTISIDRMTSEDLGHGVNVRDYPALVWGARSTTDLPPDVAEDIEGVKRLYQKKYPHLEPAIQLDRGVAWFAHGETESFTLISHQDYSDTLVTIHTKNVGASDVRKFLIESAIAINRR